MSVIVAFIAKATDTCKDRFVHDGTFNDSCSQLVHDGTFNESCSQLHIM